MLRPWRRSAATPSDASEDVNLPSNAMRGTEKMYGYIVAAELVLVAVLNLVVTHGPGAPKHPSYVIEIVGLVGALALFGVLQTRHRLIVAFSGILVAFFVVLPRVPNSLSIAHLLGLIVPFVYALLLSQRQRKAALAQGRAGRSGGQSRVRQTPEQRRAEVLEKRREKRLRRRGLEPVSGPKANRRYTPPKPRRRTPPPAGR